MTSSGTDQQNSLSTLALFKLIAPKVPRVVSDAAYHTLGLTSTSAKWDLKTAVIISVLRSFLNSPKASPVSRQQKISLRDPGIRGPMWISKQTLPAPDEASSSDVLEHLETAIYELAAGDQERVYARPAIRPVEIEWTGSRAGANSMAPRPDLDEDGQYERLMGSVTSDVTVLYIHGGALYLMDPATHRITCARLAKHSGGRCASVRYRLAPQNPFPAALLDAFVAYLSLLSPPPGAVHAPVAAKDIVFAGDSAGGTLCLALTQLILQLRRANGGKPGSVKFHGKQVEVSIPAGLALMSPWVDLTRCLPSIFTNLKYDYLPAPKPDLAKTYEPDELWPTKPPRGDLYCETGMLTHPLVNPISAADWAGVPPTFICVGEECLTDEGKIIARRLSQAGTKVEFLEFEAMPHVFTAVFGDLRGAQIAMERWGQFTKSTVEAKAAETKGTWIEAKTLKEKEFSVEGLLLPELSDEIVRERVEDAKAKRALGEGGDERYMARL